jgi:hypothetical protein
VGRAFIYILWFFTLLPFLAGCPEDVSTFDQGGKSCASDADCGGGLTCRDTSLGKVCVSFGDSGTASQTDGGAIEVGDAGPLPFSDGGSVGGNDSGPDSGTVPDGGTDAGQDQVEDGGVSAGPDAGTDSGSTLQADSGLDSGVDAGPDSGANSGLDSGVDSGLDSGVDSGLDSGVDSGLDSGVDSGLDSGVDSGLDSGVDSGIDSGNDSGVDSGPCGNGVLELDEVCDDPDFQGYSCAVGTLACSEACTFDATACTLSSLGTGADGSRTVSTNEAIGADGAASRVTAISGRVLTTAGDPTGTIAAGDEILLVNVRGTNTDCNTVGRHEFAIVESITSNSVTVTQDLTTTFGVAGNNDDLTGQRLAIVRVAQYTDLTIQSGGHLTAPIWNGTSGGVMVIRVSGTLTVAAGASINADGAGSLGGVGWSSDWHEDGRRGQSICNGHNSQTTNEKEGGGGGGLRSNPGSDDCGQGGGGGGYGQGGDWEEFETGCYNIGHRGVDNGGLTYGDAQLTNWYLGSGGGSGATDEHSGWSGSGGDGGGLLLIYADTLALNGEISAKGEAGFPAPTDFTDSGNGGGGSGGSLFISSKTLTGTGTLSVAGGPGAPSQGTWNAPGANGGQGRLRLDFQNAGGFDWGTTEATVWLENLVPGGPGHTEPHLQ